MLLGVIRDVSEPRLLMVLIAKSPNGPNFSPRTIDFPAQTLECLTPVSYSFRAQNKMGRDRIISDKQALILSMLVGGESKYGLELIKESNGKLKRGGIYVILSRMEDYGLVESELRDAIRGKQGPARRVYKITANGGRALERKQDELALISGILANAGGAQ